MWQELVGDERHAISRPAEQFGEERVIAPVALVAYGMNGEDVLEHETCEIERGNDIRERYQIALLL